MTSTIHNYVVIISLNRNETLTSHLLFQIDGGQTSDEEMSALFNVYGVRNVGKDTYVEITNLTLTQGVTYYAWVVG